MYVVPKLTARSATVAAPRIGSWLDLDAAQTVDQIVWEVTVPGDGAAVVTVALYALRTPASLTVDRVAITAAISATAAAIKTVDIPPLTLPRGAYAVIAESTGHNVTLPTLRGATAGARGVASGLTEALTDNRGGIHSNAIVGAVGLPASFALTPTSTPSHGLAVALRAA